jgi:hypothetical protein
MSLFLPQCILHDFKPCIVEVAREQYHLFPFLEFFLNKIPPKFLFLTSFCTFWYLECPINCHFSSQTSETRSGVVSRVWAIYVVTWMRFAAVQEIFLWRKKTVNGTFWVPKCPQGCKEQDFVQYNSIFWLGTTICHYFYLSVFYMISSHAL